MAIAVDSRSTGATAVDGASTHSHTTAGSDRVLYAAATLAAGGGGGATGTISSATYNGVAMTQIGHVNLSTLGNAWGGPVRIYLFRLIAPDTGAHNIVVTPTFSTQCRVMVSSISLTGVHQTTPENAAGPHTVDTANAQPTVTVTSAADEWCLACFSLITNPDPTPSVGAGQTGIGDHYYADPVFVQHLFTDEDAGGSSVTLDYTGMTLNSGWGVGGIGVSVVPTGGGGGGTPLVINKPRFADLTFNVHKKNRTIGLRGGLSTALRPEGVAAAASKAVKPHARTASRAELVKTIHKGRPSRLVQLAAPITGGVVVSGSGLAIEFRYSMPWLR